MRKQILVVDDDPLYIDLVRDIFAMREIDVLSSPDATAALSLLKNLTPSLIVSDFDMPEMNGLEFHSRLQESESTKHIPFVFLTGSADISLSQYANQHRVRVFSKNNIVNELLRLSNDLQ